ncbi:MAG TPA: bifunctional precorrin-2 dehydrogenase/sirohydrochlorin ferrochelatase [Patescibacteria group bacterium]|nr:bifunctional precorrin-2 dehydrogenase/sirohydrochlorin ferrochelatase [Patescibacteria group bacterium]
MEFYPINLKLTGRHCVVLGGGAVAERKAAALLEAGGAVTVVSPRLTDTLQEWGRSGRIQLRERGYTAGDLAGCFMAVCATDDRNVNRQAAAEATSAGVLVNVADAPELSDFTVPARVVRGDLLLTVSTGGHSPALARRLREELEEQYGPEYGQYLDLLAQVRQSLKDQLATSSERESFWRSTIDQQTLALLREGRRDEAEERVRNAASSTGT